MSTRSLHRFNRAWADRRQIKPHVMGLKNEIRSTASFLVAFLSSIDEITGLWADLAEALWDAQNAAFQLAYLAYQACLAACELIPPFDLVINPFP
jgi:hypothetical protein